LPDMRLADELVSVKCYWASCLSEIRAVLSDLDICIEDDEQAMQRESEKCNHYEEETKLLEKQYGQNVKNLQRFCDVQ